ncbi:uroporphyrinogen-III C-methyltransferase [Carboxylicivirga sediminis]|uniref:uroporphyrinogen-III C-methyltransferase n=1 Tax=Carboxylicivirga sediminis TaxID=2006564 RepID=A0A941F4M4_9BACT|nr:uroporphyrinogen-III C-methyltransferase [Carboxylicivirga sediminis]MBR8535130.1 uroporphyrinogen-III C-methyltransferase [Carboxylicivirga sediminis]
MNPNYGKVWLVGAGPGDADLISVKAVKLLKQADIVLYDYLVNKELLDYCPDSCEMVYVGKKKDKHTFPQEELNELIAHYASKGQNIVRLKGGDPFVFGRGVEEIMTLIEYGIDYEVVPGITSGVAVPAYMGIPVTARHVASSVTFVTGHPAKGNNSVDWQALAKASDTLVVYMGVSNAQRIANELIIGGKKQETPVALIRWGTYPQQEMLTATLKTIGDVMEDNGFQPPALMVIGEVVNFSEQLKPVIQSVKPQELIHV